MQPSVAARSTGLPMSHRVRVALVSLVVATTGAIAVTPAEATTSGTNGEISFARQVPTGGADIFVANPDGTHVQQVPLIYPAEDFGLPRWSPDGNRLLISNTLRLDAQGELLPFRPATVIPSGGNFDLLQPPDAPFDMACFGG